MPADVAAPGVSLERLLTLVLALDEARPIPASELARRARVSLRTIYRDVRRLQEAGVPIVSEAGRAGGLLLAPGFRLAPLGLTRGETLALSMAVQLLRCQPERPFRAELETAARKLASAARVERPELLADVQRWLRVEPPADDAFHPERPPVGARPDEAAVGATVQAFVDALVAGRSVAIEYHSPYEVAASELHVDPAGVVADRGLWYLVAFPRHALKRARYLRADRVRRCRAAEPMDLERQARWRPGEARPWLREAMRAWIEASPVVLEMNAVQWQRLARDWYFGAGVVEPAGPEGGPRALHVGRRRVRARARGALVAGPAGAAACARGLARAPARRLARAGGGARRLSAAAPARTHRRRRVAVGHAAARAQGFMQTASTLLPSGSTTKAA